MPLQPTISWEVNVVATNGDTVNSGGFDVGNANMDATGAAIFATTSAPCFNSGNAVSEVADIGYHLFIKSGTNWTPGWYPITSIGVFLGNIQAAGTGYTVNDVLTFTGGTGTAAQVKVTATSSNPGPITAVTVLVAGAYSVLPSTPISVTGGTGSGAQFNATWGWVLNAGIFSPAGCATTSSPTAATWSCDFSQNTTARYTFTDMVIDATTNTKFTSSGNPVNKKMIGNTINVTSGTGFTVQYVSILSTVTTVATCDTALGTVGSINGNGNQGGALLSPGKAAAVKVAGNDVWVRTGTYPITSATVNISGGAVYDNTGGVGFANNSNWRGYNTARWNPSAGPTASDITNRPLIQASGAISAFSVVRLGNNGTAAYINFDNFTIDGAAKTTTLPLNFSGYYSSVVRCKITGGTNQGVAMNNAYFQSLQFCEVTAITGGNFAVDCGYSTSADPCLILGCEIHDCTGNSAAIGTGAAATVVNNIVYNNNSDGIGSLGNYGAGLLCTGNVCFGNGRYGIHLGRTGGGSSLVSNNICYSNTTAQFYLAALQDDSIGFNNAGTLSTPSFFSKFQGQVALTGNPFVSSATYNFALSPSGANYAALKAAGILGAYPRGLTTSYADIGAAQHADPVGGSSPLAIIKSNTWEFVE